MSHAGGALSSVAARASAAVNYGRIPERHPVVHAAAVVEDRGGRVAGLEQGADGVGRGGALGAVAEEHGWDGGVELAEMIEDLVVRDAASAGDRGLAVEARLARVDERPAVLEVLDE